MEIETEDTPGGDNVDKEASTKDMNYTQEDITENVDFPPVQNDPEYGNSRQESRDITYSQVLESLKLTLLIYSRGGCGANPHLIFQTYLLFAPREATSNQLWFSQDASGETN